MMARKRTAPKREPLRLDVPDEVTAAVKARIEKAAAPSKGAFWEMYPTFREAVDALPNLDPLYRVGYELRAIPLDGYRDLGVEVPREVWDALGLSQFYRR